eukprot:8352834-Pyramimonas_sp.AAC.1
MAGTAPNRTPLSPKRLPCGTDGPAQARQSPPGPQALPHLGQKPCAAHRGWQRASAPGPENAASPGARRHAAALAATARHTWLAHAATPGAGTTGPETAATPGAETTHSTPGLDNATRAHLGPK